MDIREQLSFALPQQVLNAILVYCTDAYGSMLWDFQSASTVQFFKSWNSCVESVCNLPWNTFTYLIEGFLAENIPTLRNQVLLRSFYRKLLSSPCTELSVLLRIIENDPRSTTCRNLRFLRNATKVSQPELRSGKFIQTNLPTKSVPAEEEWRVGLLWSCLNLRSDIERKLEDSASICAMITSLCNT